MEQGIRPKSDLMHTASWEQLHSFTEHWKSDLEFYSDEIRFMKNLIDKYFLWLVKDESMSHLRALVNQILDHEKAGQLLLHEVNDHITKLAAFVEGTIREDEQEFRHEHVELEQEVISFTQALRDLKRKQFKMLGAVLRTEKLQRLLAG